MTRLFGPALWLTVITASVAQTQPLTVQVATKPGGEWKSYPTRLLEHLPASARANLDTGLDQYGGLSSRKLPATGFFYPTNFQGRWWLVDPDGGLFLHKAVVSVSPLRTSGAQKAFQEKFGSTERWAESSIALLRENGFNGLGAWSSVDTLRGVSKPVAYTTIWNFMSAYGKKRGGTYQKPGHTGYPSDCIFVFDPEFEKFCDEQAKSLEKGSKDPWLLGHFSDNEMPYRRDPLKGYLSLPESDPGHQAAKAWLQKKHGPNANLQKIATADEAEFTMVVADRYYRIVSKAIKKCDPNHLYLGSRFHGSDTKRPELFRAAGPYLDLVAVNYYHGWTPDASMLAMWTAESKKPCIITEWYAKGMDSGMANTGGAGWLVKTQKERGYFYQNFVLGLLESKTCVGWHWFKYQDNDPEDTKADPSNRDSNKGIVNARFELYRDLLGAMKPLNERVYSLVDYFDHAAK
ncbi:MAG: hypothetical protein WCO56_16840 [Verrucomicrobiota bacterium]